MLAEQISRGALASRIFDVCLIGAGPAGVTLATELGARGHSVLLLEAGGASYEESSQAMYSGEVVGALKFALDTSRLRYLGGASNPWGGFCQALDAVEAVVAHAGALGLQLARERTLPRARGVLHVHDDQRGF